MSRQVGMLLIAGVFALQVRQLGAFLGVWSHLLPWSIQWGVSGPLLAAESRQLWPITELKPLVAGQYCPPRTPTICSQLTFMFYDLFSVRISVQSVNSIL